MDLETLGWDESWQETFEHQYPARTGECPGSRDFSRDPVFPARVCGIDRSLLTVAHGGGESRGRLVGPLLRTAKEEGMPVAVGDWVACRQDEPLSILGILPRRSVLQRKEAISGGRKLVDGEVGGGRTRAQVVAANIDLALIVTPLDPLSEPGFGLSRIERSLILCNAGGVDPVAVYNKCDLVGAAWFSDFVETARAVCPRVLMVSALGGQGIDELRKLLGPGKTAVLFGPSGAGKSSLVNALMALPHTGESISTGESGKAEGHPAFIPLDTGPLSISTGKGLHTTAWRELLVLPGGGMIVDTPGMRELALWADQDVLDDSFDDIAALARECRFSDCRHMGEPGCAVREALGSGSLDERRFENWLRMSGEVRRLDTRKIALWQKQQSREKRYFDLDHR